MSGVGGGVGGYWLCARLSICIVSRQAIVNLCCQVGTQPNQTAPGAAYNARQLIKSWHGQRQRRPSSRPKAARNRCQLIWLIVLRSDPIGQISNVTNCQMLLWPAELEAGASLARISRGLRLRLRRKPTREREAPSLLPEAVSPQLRAPTVLSCGRYHNRGACSGDGVNVYY